MTKHAQQWGKRHLKINAVPTCTAAVHVLSFCRSLQRAFSSLCPRKICDVVNNHLLQIFRFATVKLKTMLLDFLYLGHSLLKHMVRKLKAFNYSSYCRHNSGLFSQDRVPPIHYYHKFTRRCSVKEVL